MATIPDYHDYLVNYPLFWKPDLFDSLPLDIKESVKSDRGLIGSFIRIFKGSWPHGKLTEKNVGVAFYQVTFK